jgi:mono/diheme cytochrome c family protein
LGVKEGTTLAAAGALASLAVAAVAMSGLIFAGCKGNPLTPQQAAGQQLYEGRCAHCHGENDLRLKPAPPNIQGVLTKSLLPSGARASDVAVRNLVLTGKNKMPSFQGRFTEEQMAALLAYLHTDMQ